MNTETEKDSSSLLDRLKRLGAGILIALPFVGAGTYIMGISYGFLPSDPESFLAPRGIVGLAGVFFVVAGLMVLLHISFGETGQKSLLFQVLNNTLGLAFVTIFGLLFAWAGLGPGERVFEGGVSIGPVSIFHTMKTLLEGTHVCIEPLATSINLSYYEDVVRAGLVWHHRFIHVVRGGNPCDIPHLFGAVICLPKDQGFANRESE